MFEKFFNKPGPRIERQKPYEQSDELMKLMEEFGTTDPAKIDAMIAERVKSGEYVETAPEGHAPDVS